MADEAKGRGPAKKRGLWKVKNEQKGAEPGLVRLK